MTGVRFGGGLAGYRRCKCCGSNVMVVETNPPGGFLDWLPFDAEKARLRLDGCRSERDAARAVAFRFESELWRIADGAYGRASIIARAALDGVES